MNRSESTRWTAKAIARAARVLAIALTFSLNSAAKAETASDSASNKKVILQTGTVSKTVIRSSPASGSGNESGKNKASSSGKGHAHGGRSGKPKGRGHGHGKSKTGKPGKSGTGTAVHHPSPVSVKPPLKKHKPVTIAKPVVPAPKPKPLLNMTAVPDVRAAAKQLIEAGKLVSADWLLKKGIEFNPDDPGLTNDLADVALARAKSMIDRGFLECALMRLREALFLNPDLFEAEDLINQILRKQGHDPENADERLKLADGLAKEHRFVAAIVEYRESLKLRPSAPAFIGLGDMYMKAGQPEMAKSAYQQAIAVDPGYSVAQSRAQSFPQPKAADWPDLLNPVTRSPQPVKDAPSGRLLTGLWKNQDLDKYMELARRAVRSNQFARTTTGGTPRLPARQTIVPIGRPAAPAPVTPKVPAKLPDLILMNPTPDIDGGGLPDPVAISQKPPSGAETEGCACQ